MAITKKRRAFIEAYFRCGFNATEAARQAKYKHPNVKGTQLVKVSEIAEEIQRRIEEEIMCPSETLLRLSRMARVDISWFVDKDTGAIDWDAVNEIGYLVKKVVHRKGQQSQIELYDAQAALVHLGKHHGLFKDRIEHTGPEGGPIVATNTIIVREYIKDDEGD